ncbi:cytochrome P450 [Elsinoe ampelina]|uniref:Cytochrome P450 n=1 Tax=Elsinoe ampelina TaxID=302913 RepID=A0A6A6G0D8_9PEZI|nr:cytochrome P450 [Elsinoe ampelina]
MAYHSCGSQALQVAFLPGLRRIPGPLLAPWTKLPLKLKVVQGQRSQYVDALVKKYGPFVRIGPREVVTADLAALKYIHRMGTDFHKSPWYYKISQTKGVFSEHDPKRHAERRRLFAPNFTASALLRQEVVVRKNFDLAVSKINRDACLGKADIFKWFTFMSTDIFGELAFGQSFNMLEHEKKNQYVEDLEATMKILGFRAELEPLFQFANLFPIKKLRQVMSLKERLDSYAASAIRIHRDYVAKYGVEKSPLLMASFLDPQKTSQLSEQELIGEASDLILAGADTSAITLTYLVWCLLRPQNRLIRDRIVKEVESISVDADFRLLNGNSFLQNVINEVLRLYGAAPTCQPRIVPPQGSQLGPYFLPGGVTVNTQAYTFHRDPTIFREPEKFDPDRWIDATDTMKEAFHPFGSGARSCLGQNLARLELTLGLFLFFKHCGSAELCPETTDESMEFEDYALIAPKARRCNIFISQG